MSLTPEQIIDLKNQLKTQVSHLPDDKKAQALSQIDSLSSEALEEMIKEQKEKNKKTIFRMIVDGEVNSVKVGENSENIAVLDINPISKGHVMIIPKTSVKEVKDLPKSALDLSKEISSKIIEFLKAKSVKTESSTIFGEAVINIIPIYDKDLDKDSKRTKADVKELEEIKKALDTIKIEKKVETIKIENKTGSENQVLKINRRIP